MSDFPQSAAGELWFKVPRRIMQHMPGMSRAELKVVLEVYADESGEGIEESARGLAKRCHIKADDAAAACRRLENLSLIVVEKGRGNQKSCYRPVALRTKQRTPDGGRTQQLERTPDGGQTAEQEQDLRTPSGARQCPPIGESPHTPLIGSKKSSSETKKKTTLNSDDERRLQRTGTETPKEEFLLRLRERHGARPNPTDVLEVVIGELEKGAIDFEEFLDWDDRHTTAPSRLDNPTGHYRKLAEKIVRQKSKEAKQRMVEMGVSIYRSVDAAMVAPIERCAICKGLGRLGSEYCECPMGCDLKKAESRPPTVRATAS
ncbi:MAG: hypothetical protein IT168_05925 [Bryobacterales bacterium]|nr:hypothetical protein [Bryobacterales bacterium]